MREAGEIAIATSRREFKRWTKGHDNSPVSEADLAVNDFLKNRLPVLAPQAGWLSEETEDDPAARATDTVWIVDPIDGTRAFITKRPDWTICVALVDRGRPQLAGVYAPVTNEMFLAAAGLGATRNGTPIGVSSGGDLSGARTAGPRRYLDHLATLSPGTQQQPKVYSLALRLTRVAEGAFDVALSSPGSHDWDLAAADLLIHEAGGILTDIAGHGLRYNRPETTHGTLIATSTARHGPLIGLMRDRLPEFV
ncbi:3'(2'),5'-bisphosphate nucleotidase CysQ [Undibacter mobilis]|uniref:3'(2'),5'-bisphosphate nucleotidase CysQ n=1 Tax=Undibacter mobilis TaxID=2292256 RepID=A0A371BE13_9BRAD|nr:3'(2'),5'-bisphosphate nucleotidase CysQ [Undibacter mobilis]